MKNILLPMLFLSLNLAKGQKNKATPMFSIEMGYKSLVNAIRIQSQDKYYIARTDIYKSPIYINVSFGVKYKYFEINNQIETYSNYENGSSLSPKQVGYTTEIKYSKKNIEFGYVHYCSHPVIAYLGDMPNINYTTSFDKLTVKYFLIK
jgi:hypothetical protein